MKTVPRTGAVGGWIRLPYRAADGSCAAALGLLLGLSFELKYNLKPGRWFLVQTSP